jgi:hypothetical protein
MGIYVYRARSPKKGFETVILTDPVIESLRGKPLMVRAAVAEYAYKTVCGGYADGDRYLNPTERAWERWLDEGNERPQFITCNEKLYRWTGLIGFYDHAVDSWEEVEFWLKPTDQVDWAWENKQALDEEWERRNREVRS